MMLRALGVGGGQGKLLDRVTIGPLASAHTHLRHFLCFPFPHPIRTVQCKGVGRPGRRPSEPVVLFSVC